MFYQKLKNNKDTDKDPEKICQLVDELNNLNLKYKLLNYFKDIGRNIEYNDENTIRGWYQKTSNINQNISLSYISIDILLKSIIYLLSNKKFNKIQLKTKIENYLQNIFMKEIINKILNKYELNENMYFKYYQQCLTISNKKNLDIRYIYHNINELVVE